MCGNLSTPKKCTVVKSWNRGTGFWVLTLISVAASSLVILRDTQRSKSKINSVELETTRDRMKSQFCSLNLWNCKWTWDWTEKLEPINIQGYCTGENNPLRLFIKEMRCNYPVEIRRTKVSGEHIAGISDLEIVCRREKDPYHEPIRATFKNILIPEVSSQDEINAKIASELEKIIIRERDRRIPHE